MCLSVCVTKILNGLPCSLRKSSLATLVSIFFINSNSLHFDSKYLIIDNQ